METTEGQVLDQTASKPSVEKIIAADIKPIIPQDNGSVFVLQRNAKDKDNRSLPVESPRFGTLDAGEAEATQAQSKDYFDQIFKDLSPEERAKIDILVVAGNASLRMPNGKSSPHKRSVETAEHTLTGIKASMEEHGVDASQLLNKTGKPIELSSGRLIDLKMFDESPEFVNFLKDKYNYTQDDPLPFWEAYEDDREKVIRERMEAEGPKDIADRVGDYMATLDNAMKLYHQSHPGRKVIVIANSQYDSISPTLKKYVTGQSMGTFLPVDYRGGVTFEVGADGSMSTSLQGHEYSVSFTKLPRQESAHTPSPEKIDEVLSRLRNEPLDPARIEEVVNKYAEKLIRHKKGAIIFSGSGSGKSTTIREQVPNGEGKTDLVDADFIYKELGAHPMKLGTEKPEPEEWWHMGDEVIDMVDKRCAQINQAMIDKGIWALTTSFTNDDSYVSSNVVVVMLPWEEHKRRIITKTRGDYYDGGAKATFRGFSAAEGHRKWAEDVSQKKNIPVVDSIDAAVDLIRSREG